MVTVTKHKLIITIHSDDPQILLDKIRESITDTASILVESDEFKNQEQIPGAVSTLIKLQGELFTEPF